MKDIANFRTQGTYDGPGGKEKRERTGKNYHRKSSHAVPAMSLRESFLYSFSSEFGVLLP